MLALVLVEGWSLGGGDAFADGHGRLSLRQLPLATGQTRFPLGEHDLGLLLQGGLLAADPVLGALQRLHPLLHGAAKAAGGFLNPGRGFLGLVIAVGHRLPLLKFAHFELAHDRLERAERTVVGPRG